MGLAIILTDFEFSPNLGEITSKKTTEPKYISISGDANIVGTSATYSVNYAPIYAEKRSVVWSIASGDQYASIDGSTGIVTILSGANNSSVTLKATLSTDSSIFATKTISVTYMSASSIYQLEKTFAANEYIDTELALGDNTAYPNWCMFIEYQNVSFNKGEKKYVFKLSNGSSPYQGISIGQNDSTISYLQLILVTNTKETLQFPPYDKSGSTTSSTYHRKNLSVPSQKMAFRKVNGVYYWTLDGVTWNSNYTSSVQSFTETAKIGGVSEDTTIGSGVYIKTIVYSDPYEDLSALFV